MMYDDFDDGHNNCDPTKNLCLSGRLNKGEKAAGVCFTFCPLSALNWEDHYHGGIRIMKYYKLLW